MHLSRKINKCVVFLFTVFIFVSCKENNSDRIVANTICTDTLYYKISPKASDILDRLLADYEPSCIYLRSNADENKYHFTFFLIKSQVKSEKIDYILKHSYRVLKTNKNIIKILLDEDERFSVSPENIKNYTNHYPVAGIIVNAKGDLLDYFSEEYKLQKNKENGSE